MKIRPEQEIFDELAKLCVSPGYAHAISYFCFRDQVVRYADELKGEDYAQLFSKDRLIRTEISTMIGLMLRSARDLAIPDPKQLQDYIEHTETLLKELHHAMNAPAMEALKAAMADHARENTIDPFSSADAMREPIFYGAESAYSFQYRDLAVQKYVRDDDWLLKNKGFTSEDGKKVVCAISEFLNEKLLTTLKGLKDLPLEQRTALEGFSFSATDIVTISGLAAEVVKAFIAAFSFPEEGNPTFTSLHAFNSANAFPFFKGDGDNYILFLYVSLTEALYDTPFYWMTADRAYQATAMTHRGQFTEEFTSQRLEKVFGANKVFRNVDIWDTKARKNKLGEIDTLVLIADRAIVLQAKSKKLTLEARKGNDLQLQTDFKGAVQDACDQAVACSKHLLVGTAVFTDATGKEIHITNALKHIHPVCVVSDHYPALSFQARQFLKFSATDVINSPLVCDVFFIDVVTKFLDTPLRCLSYLELRAKAGDNVMLSHEIAALGFHLKKNLWVGEVDLLVLEDDIAVDVDIAMAVRRDGVTGDRTPPGVRTLLGGTAVGCIIDEIEKRSDAAAIGIVLELLKLSGNSAKNLSLAIVRIAADAKDGKEHDVTIATEGVSGITIHCNSLPNSIAAQKLQAHCEVRKYSQHAPEWFGLALQPKSAALRFGLMLEYPWTHDSAMDEVVAKMPKAQPIAVLRKITNQKAKGDKRSGKGRLNKMEKREVILQSRKFREMLKRTT